MNGFCQCPRCGDQAFERLETYSHCVGCLYFEDYYHDIQRSAFEAQKVEQTISNETLNEEPKTASVKDAA